ncbi:NAD(P)H-dependent oxidoreductase [Kordiimonas gwangyangensis]|uniref:NAD(P)H-dependent oxidoreductase n=1 Tax=Kordiimonas gwangyangensis TaxID=288022 RepID=UPI0003637B80|nr:NAD(P)H-dependent oxidoreductase [Kordiimonas gwangyangensis]
MSVHKNIVLILGHPDSSEAHFCHALADRYRAGAESAGHRVTTVDVGRLDFPLLRSRKDWEEGETPPALKEAQRTILDADHLVIIFPLWLGGMPALLKGFLEQVLRPSLAASPKEWGKLLKGCSARIIVTMGMPGFFYRLFYRAHSLKALKRNILAFTGVGPIGTTVFGLVEGASEEKRAQRLALMHRYGHNAD